MWLVEKSFKRNFIKYRYFRFRETQNRKRRRTVIIQRDIYKISERTEAIRFSRIKNNIYTD